jgi:hypothetical protein
MMNQEYLLESTILETLSKILSLNKKSLKWMQKKAKSREKSAGRNSSKAVGLGAPVSNILRTQNKGGAFGPVLSGTQGAMLAQRTPRAGKVNDNNISRTSNKVSLLSGADRKKQEQAKKRIEKLKQRRINNADILGLKFKASILILSLVELVDNRNIHIRKIGKHFTYPIILNNMYDCYKMYKKAYGKELIYES